MTQQNTHDGEICMTQEAKDRAFKELILAGWCGEIQRYDGKDPNLLSDLLSLCDRSSILRETCLREATHRAYELDWHDEFGAAMSWLRPYDWGSIAWQRRRANRSRRRR